MVGSAFYGPVLAVFVLGVLAPGVTGAAALAGLAAGLAGEPRARRASPGSPVALVEPGRFWSR